MERRLDRYQQWKPSYRWIKSTAEADGIWDFVRPDDHVRDFTNEPTRPTRPAVPDPSGSMTLIDFQCEIFLYREAKEDYWEEVEERRRLVDLIKSYRDKILDTVNRAILRDVPDMSAHRSMLLGLQQSVREERQMTLDHLAWLARMREN